MFKPQQSLHLFKLVAIFTIGVCFGCSEKNINYRSKTFKKLEKEGFEFRLNDALINPKFYFFDQHNIKEIVKSKHSKTLSIYQKDKFPKLVSIAEIFEKLKNGDRPEELKTVVINGYPFERAEFARLKIELLALREINYLTNEEISRHLSHARGSVLILTTKN